MFLWIIFPREPEGLWPQGFGTQPDYKATNDLQVKIKTGLWSKLGEYDCLFVSGPNLALGQPNKVTDK